VQDAGVTSVYHEDHATEYPRAYVMPFDKEVLQGGKKAHDFAHALRQHIEGKHSPYKWCVRLSLSLFFPPCSCPSQVRRELTPPPSCRIRGGFVLVDAVPKSPAGKILRRMLKDCKGHEVQVYEEKPRAKL